MKTFDELFEEMLVENRIKGKIHSFFAFLDETFGENILHITKKDFDEAILNYISTIHKPQEIDFYDSSDIFKSHKFHNRNLIIIYKLMTDEGLSNDDNPFDYYKKYSVFNDHIQKLNRKYPIQL